MDEKTADPVVVTDSLGRARLPHGLDATPTWVLLRLGDAATVQQMSFVKLVAEEFDADTVGFRALRADTGAPLIGAALPIRMSVLADYREEWKP